MSEARYALYAAPDPRSPLWRFGSALIGYDAATGDDPPAPAGLGPDPATWSAWTDEPRRYGLHGTLKAPFGLAEGAGEDDLVAAAEALARDFAPLPALPLAVTLLGGFVALTPATPQPALHALADRCVTALEPLRRPLSAADRERRLRSPLSPRQRDHLDGFGYPHVFEDFRFHMTLTGRLPPEHRESVRAELARRYAAVPPGFALDALVLFRQPDRSGRFHVMRRVPLGAG